MGECGDVLADGGKGPLGENLHMKAMRGILLEKGGGRVAYGGMGRSNVWSLGHRNII